MQLSVQRGREAIALEREAFGAVEVFRCEGATVMWWLSLQPARRG